MKFTLRGPPHSFCGLILLRAHNPRAFLLKPSTHLTNLDCVLKSKDIILLAKVHVVKVMVFPEVVYRSDDCTKKKAEH